ncbi:hypothetical protein GRF29_154g1008546 [Pseudopithomyces chartarum]|uniref:DH domain-containing protein n=1 Tax=Pseudopithomyces chartarum TaxID=1892770 RepID=A0AAN6LU90_9PLEO|nr:hypothetical protein GRF29_154g1008546 [Pseudopithomyces chartarum]
MVVTTPEPAALSAQDLSLFYTTDDLLSNSPVLVFYGPTATSTHATHSRIQAHVFTPAGLQNFARLIISPTAPFYNAVACLPREEQGDEICRGLAFSLYKYFAELPTDVKHAWERQHASVARLPSAPTLFSDAHAAIVAARMVKVDNVSDIIVDVRHALGEQTLSWLDLDLVLPQGTIQQPDKSRDSAQFDDSEEDNSHQRYGSYAPVVKLFGQSAFLPTSKLRRAPSKPTSINRSQTFTRNQKENLRREMCELLDTEENYVTKLHEMFLDVIRAVLEDTENDAIQDIEQTTDDLFVAPLKGHKDVVDVTGALAVAQALVDWFPQFGDSYSDYMAAHADFSQLLRGFTKDINSSFSKRVYETGEQRLMSMLIEPVQRLPRYNLYIDNIVKQLPLRHPAVKTFLKARDIISEICSREGPTVQQIKVLDRLRKMVYSWPATCSPQCRLITAVDFVELSPPYHGDLHGPSTTAGIFLLFADTLVILQKSNSCTTTARSLIADLDDPKFTVTDVGSSELIFHQQLKLSDVFLSEHSDGNILQMLAPNPTTTQSGRPRSRDLQSSSSRMFYLQGLYEGKAHKYVEDVTKARVESRYSEAEREGPKWEVRSLTGDLSMFTAVTEDNTGHNVEMRREPARVQVIVNTVQAAPAVQPVQHSTVELTVMVSVLDDGFFVLEYSGINGYTARDKLTSVEFLPVFTKRLGNFFQSRNSIKNPALTETHLFRNQQILKSLKLQLEEAAEGHDGRSRPHSPVKMLSNLFGNSIREGGSRKLQRNPLSLGDVPRIAAPFQLTPVRTHSRDGETSRPNSSNKTIGFNTNNSPTDSLAKLEETLATLILALHARKGNIVGRSVRARSVADELLVNELYNSLLENPSNMDAAAQSSVDVLFAAFEKFLNIGWKEKMGPVLSHATLLSLQMKSDSMYPGEFEDFFRTTYNELSPQNQRSLRAVIKLLAELLDGMGNDGDRGILTAAFAEMLVQEGSANDFISLIDRFIQDIGVLFPEPQSGRDTPNFGSMESRHRHMASGSLTSNTSLRKRFGFGTLTRQDSKNENESKVGSLWRSLSKNTHGVENQPSGASKLVGPGSLGRSNSTDAAMHLSPKRPSSRDRPTVLGAFSNDGGSVSPGPRGFPGALGTIGEREVPSTTGPPRKKRRSSLSDLKMMHDTDETPPWSWQTPRRPVSPQREDKQGSVSPTEAPRTPSRSPTKPMAIPTPTRLESPFPRLGSPMKENAPAKAVEREGPLRPKSMSISQPAKPDNKEEVIVKPYRPTLKKRGESISGIPLLRPAAGLIERPTSGNTIKVPTTPRSPTKSSSSASAAKKLKMQSPQKLRERLQNQQRDIESASRDLQSELSAIGHELTARTPRLPPQLPTSPPLSGDSSAKALEIRIAMLEKSIKNTLEVLSSRTSSIGQDVSTSLEVSEKRAKHLDKLYRDSNAENEALYSRFNEELEKVERSVRKGKGNEEVDRRLKASEEETARLRKENARLKREVAGLKAQIRE